MSRPNPNSRATVSPSDRWAAKFMPIRQAKAAMNSSQPQGEARLRPRQGPPPNRPAVIATSPMVCPSKVPAASRVIGARRGTLSELIGRSLVRFRRRSFPGLAEGEGGGPNAGVEEGDLEGVVGDRAGLADELVSSCEEPGPFVWLARLGGAHEGTPRWDGCRKR